MLKCIYTVLRYQTITRGGIFMRNNFAIILAKQRKKIIDVHEETGISIYTLTQLYYERTSNPELQTLLKIADNLNVTIDYLIDRSIEEVTA